MQSNILNIENWSSYKDEVGTHYTYKINNHYTYELYIGYDNIILDNDLYNLTICKIIVLLKIVILAIQSNIARYVEQNLNES